ncbi:MAG: isocitrate lyase [Bdellovibrionales bacterium]|nr:isocitrate lyase [Bdellovibrionales bacterium]
MKTAKELEKQWSENPRWSGIKRNYSGEEVVKLRGSYDIKYSIAEMAADKLWANINTLPYVNSLGCLTGNQAVQCVKAGLKAIYLSGWQTAADANLSGQMYPDQSLYPANSVPDVVRRINNSLRRSDQIETAEGNCGKTDWLVPIVADAEAGFGGALNAFELMKSMIEAGAGGVHFEDQLASEKKCGHLGGKVLIPTAQFIKTLTSARLASDVLGVPTVLIARTDAESAKLLTSDIDPVDHKHIKSKERTPEGFFNIINGTDTAIDRAIAYAPYADLLWCETGTPDLEQAKKFSDKVREQYPNKLLAYNCSPSFNWKRKLDAQTIAKFQKELGAMGYKFQFVTLAGFHALNHSMFTLASDYRERGMSAYSKLQESEFSSEEIGYTATKHQREVGTGYFDFVSQAVSGGQSSTLAYTESTEASQF